MPLSAPSLSPIGNPAVYVDVCGRTDVGRVREHNEDSFLIADVATGERLPDDGVAGYPAGERGLLFMVADGMGGAAAGEIASDMAVRTVLGGVVARWGATGEADPAVFARTLRGAAEEANVRIHACATEHPEYRGMGTTATIAGLLGDTLFLGQVGDSRAYLVRDGRALQITKDQSLLQRLVEAGEMTAEEAERSERRNIILQALGPDVKVVIDLTHQTVRRGDVLVICSDGLSGLVRDEEIARLVRDAGSMPQLCEQLIAEANERGGPDNVTVVAARFDGAGLRPAQVGDAVGHRRFQDHEQSGGDDWINSDPTLPPAPLGLDAQPPAAARSAGAATLAEALYPVARREQGRIWTRLLGTLVVVTVLAALWFWIGPVLDVDQPAPPSAERAPQ